MSVEDTELCMPEWQTFLDTMTRMTELGSSLR